MRVDDDDWGRGNSKREWAKACQNLQTKQVCYSLDLQGLMKADKGSETILVVS
jgi:hypothetical protein